VSAEAAAPGAVSVPKESLVIELGTHMSAVIGRGGDSIKKIQAASGASVDIDKASEGKSCTIKGTAEEVAAAHALIRDVIEGRELQEANTITEEMQIPTKQHTIIIGKGGSVIQSIQGDSGARVMVPKRDEGSDVVTLRGTREEVNEAKKLINEAIAATIPSTSFTIPFDSNPLGIDGVRNFFLQNKAERLKGLEKQTGTKIEIEKDTKESDGTVTRGKKVIIYGDMQPVLQASTLITSLLKENSFSDEVAVDDPKKIGAVIGKGGEVIRRLQEETGANISCDRGSNVFKVVGTASQVTTAKGRILRLLDGEEMPTILKPGEVKEVLQLPKYAVGAVIGAKGAVVRELQETSGAAINVQSGAPVDGNVPCTIIGQKASVASAVAAINVKVAEAKAANEARNAAVEQSANAAAVTAESFSVENAAVPAASGDSAWGGGAVDGGAW
jgi:polyribonucleotide nucleotidyltransferase